MIRRLWAALLAFLIAVPSGAFAAGFVDGAAPETIAPATLPALPAVSLPTVGVSQVPSAPAGVVGITQAMAPQLHAIAQPNAPAEGSAQAGENATRILQGGKAQDGGSAVDAGAAAPAAASPLAASQPSSAAPQTPAAPSAPKGPDPIDSRRAYNLRRAFLAAVSTLFGVNYSLPRAGPRLSARLLQEASSKETVLSDIDDTLTKYSTVLGPETAAAVVSVRKSGKLFAAITDRSDSVKPGSGQLSAFDSLASIPVSEREGIIVATNGGGKIYEYQADGTPKLLYQEAPIPESQVTVIKQAAEVIKARLPQAGTEFDKEFYNPHSYGMILKAGTPEATVKALAAEFQKELHARGVDYEVEGRMAKDPKLPPYLNLSKLDKSVAVKRIAELKKIKAGEAVILGDSMYKPNDAPASLSAAGRAAVSLAESIAGPRPLTGNAADRNMERALPGALTLAVGGTADAVMKNAWVLEKGTGTTLRVLQAVAARPSRTIAAEHEKLVGQRGDYDRSIAQAGPRADRVTSERWSLIMDKRDEVIDKISRLEKRFPALTGEEPELPRIDPLAAKAIQTDISSPARAIYAAQDFLGAQYVGLRLASAKAVVEKGAVTGWTVEFYGRPKDAWFPRLRKFALLTAAVKTDSISAVRGDERRSLGEDAAPYEELWRAKFGNAAYTDLAKVLGNAQAFYPDFEVDGLSLVRQVKEWSSPAMMPMDPTEYYSETVWNYIVTGKSKADPRVTLAQEIDVTHDGTVINLEARAFKGGPEADRTSPDAQVWANLTVYGDFGDFDAATSKPPLRVIIDERRQKIIDRYHIGWISPELDSISVPNTSFDGSGRYFHYRVRMAKKDFDAMKAESRFKALVSLDYAEGPEIPAAPKAPEPKVARVMGDEERGLADYFASRGFAVEDVKFQSGSSYIEGGMGGPYEGTLVEEPSLWIVTMKDAAEARRWNKPLFRKRSHNGSSMIVQ